MAVVVGWRSAASLRFSQLGFEHAENAMRPGAPLHETGPKVGEGGVKTGEAG